MSIFFLTYAGVYTNSSFTVLDDGINDSGLLYLSGLQLGVSRDIGIKIFGDEILPLTSVSIYSDVISCMSDTFSFFYVMNSSNSNSGVYRREARITGGFNASPATPEKITDFKAPANCYLHADKGESGFLVSYVSEGVAFHKLQMSTGSARMDIDSSNEHKFLFPSQCHMAGDTFLIVYSINNDSIKMKKVYASGTTIQVVTGALVSVNNSGEKLMNCSIASDGIGGILVAWSQGYPIGEKKIHYRFFDNTLTPITGSFINQPIGDGKFYHYDDVGVASLDSMRFAMVHWDTTGLWLSTISLKNGSNHRTSNRIVIKPQLRYATIASNHKYCIVACNGDVDGDQYAGIEGIRFDNNGGVLQNPVYYSYSEEKDVGWADPYSTAINAVLDTAGNFAVTWRYQSRIQGSIFAQKSIRNSFGFWTSPIESLSITSGDSVRFQPANIAISSLKSWDLYDSIRIGATVQACRSAPWISLSDRQALYAHASTHRYFQYRIGMKRKEGDGDSLSSPVISSVTIPWNIKPQLLGVDSIKIGNDRFREYTIGSDVNVFSRSDSVRLRIRLRDPDVSDRVYLIGSWPASSVPMVLSGNSAFDTTVFLPAVVVDTSVLFSLSIWDVNEWNATVPVFRYTSRNSIPRLIGTASYNDEAGIRNPRNIETVDTILIHENDSLVIQYAIADSNDESRVAAYISRQYRGTRAVLDSVISAGQSTFVIRGDTALPSYSTNILLSVSDPDTTFEKNILFSINHSPIIDSLYLNGVLVAEQDSARVVINGMAKIEIVAHDVDCSFGDTLRYQFQSAERTYSATFLNRVGFFWIPQRADTNLVITVYDRYGKSDSLLFFIKYPWMETDSSINSEFSRALDMLYNSVSLIVGNPVGDTVYLPILNSGKDTLCIYSIQCQSPEKNWLRVGIPADTGLYVVNFIDSIFTDTLTFKAGEQKLFPLFFSTGSLAGDSTIVDTLTITTNDSSHLHYKIPIRMEYNDLPKIISVTPEFAADIPWRLHKRSGHHYNFPPHASISVQFSEPVDSSSVHSGMQIYSVIDSSHTGSREFISLKKTWSQNYTKLHCTPVYQHTSSVFNIQPPEGLFIPTDIVAVRFTGDIIDKANTPSGPNVLDINSDFNKNDSDQDTIIRLTVDSIGFSVVSVTPAMFDTHIVQRPLIALTFSSSVYAESIDRTLIGNRSLIVRSIYNNGEQLNFDSVYVNGSSVTFRIARTLFYGDSLWCWYNSATVKNHTGFPTDNDHNGIAIAMFDSTDRSDDLFWSYRVKSVTVVSTDPDVNSTVKVISPAITIHFSDTIDVSVFDTDTSPSNRSIQIRSNYSSDLSGFELFEFINGGRSIRIQPKRNFFSKDSIHCVFLGFKREYRYGAQDNLPVTISDNFSNYEWSFYTGNTGFYTYPNPYKPGSDLRHCIDHGPCGIWFKNLHILKDGVQDVEVTVYSMNTHPVFNSKRAGHIIHFENNSNEYLPQWLWDTRNQSGELVASGLYLYVIRDLAGSVLVKGKLMIVR